MAESDVDGVRAAAVGPVDITGSIAAARRDAEAYQTAGPVYSELMATYVELGELLERGRDITAESPADMVREYEDECCALVDRLAELDVPLRHQSDQRWARWCANNMDLERN